MYYITVLIRETGLTIIGVVAKVHCEKTGSSGTLTVFAFHPCPTRALFFTPHRLRASSYFTVLLFAFYVCFLLPRLHFIFFLSFFLPLLPLPPLCLTLLLSPSTSFVPDVQGEECNSEETQHRHFADDGATALSNDVHLTAVPLA